jgi:CIC family chloride channel protein
MASLRKLPPGQLMLILCIMIGALAGIAAVILKTTVHYTYVLITSNLASDSVSWVYFFVPLIGIFLTLIYVKGFIREDIVHGITRILYSISQKKSFLKAHNMYASLIASTLTVGFGGSAGLESPIVLTGSSIGSNIGRWFRLSYRDTTLLLGCGAAAAIAGIFKAPIAGTVFVLEVFMLEMTTVSISYLLVSAVTGATVSSLLLGEAVVFDFTLMDQFDLSNIPFYMVLGLFCAMVSVYFTRGTILIEDYMGKMRVLWKKLLFGGIILGILIFLFPPLYGEGYEALRMLLGGTPEDLANSSFFYTVRDNNYVLLGFLLIVLAAKVAAYSVTTGAGGVGGIFAPALFMGGVSGFIVARALRMFGFLTVSEKNFALVGMAGVMAGVMHAPLTAIFLIAEITGGYSLFIPLILTSTIAFFTVRYVQPYSIYTHRLAKRGELITHDKDKATLTLMRWNNLIEKDLLPITPEATLGELVKLIARSKRNIFPVVNDSGKLEGVVLLDDIREMMFNKEMYETTFVKDIMILSPELIENTENTESIMRKFEKTQAWNLPVVENGIYLGFLSKSRILSAYRELLVNNSSE